MRLPGFEPLDRSRGERCLSLAVFGPLDRWFSDCVFAASRADSSRPLDLRSGEFDKINFSYGGSFDKIVVLFSWVLFDKTVFLRGDLTNSFFYGCYLTKPFFYRFI